MPLQANDRGQLMTSASEPFALLADLARRSRAAARGLPAQVDITPHWSGIGFSLFGMRMVAPMGEVVEMLKVPGFTRLPGVQGWVHGVANVRGRLLPLFDLEAFFGGQLSGSRHRHRILVLEMGELYSGLVVSEVHGMQHFPVDTFTSAVPQRMAELSSYLAGSYVQTDMTWSVFSPHKLARDPRFFNAAAA
jgi:twitching motility protein PilI